MATDRWSAEWRASLTETVLEGGRFGLVGAANTLLDISLYFLLAGSLLPLAAKSLSYLAGVANGFYWNRRWTFRSQRSFGEVFPGYLAANLVGLGLNVFILHLGVEIFRLGDGPAVAAATAGVLAWNFLINKTLIFKGLKPS